MSFHVLLDFDLLLYVGLLVLFVWRLICPWRCCGQWLEYTNVSMVLFYLIFVLMLADLVQFIVVAVHDSQSGSNLPTGLRVITAFAPPAVFACFPLCFWQVREHIVKIREKSAPMKHDRAIQIIALPVVYAIMAFSSMQVLFHRQAYQAQGSAAQVQAAERTAEGRYNTCLHVADLYEAWALYQFGKLTLELLDETIASQLKPSESHPILDSQEGLGVMSFSAVADLMQLGTWMFVVVCVLQAGWSVFVWTFIGPNSPNFETYDGIEQQLWSAGLVASGAAIYNVHVVESRFTSLIEGYKPLMKFLSVKLLVFFAFWQQNILNVLRFFGWLQISADEVSMLHSAFLCIECLISALIHFWAWPVNEGWYLTKDEAEEDAKKVEGGSAGGRRSTTYSSA